MRLFQRGDHVKITQSFDVNLDDDEGYVRGRWDDGMRDDGRVNRVQINGQDQFGNENPVYMFLDDELVLIDETE